MDYTWLFGGLLMGSGRINNHDLNFWISHGRRKEMGLDG